MSRHPLDLNLITELPPSLLPTYTHLSPMSSQPTQDLTGQVKKTEPYYFAHGGSADIWMGELTKSDSGNLKVWHTYLLIRQPLPKLQFLSYR